ncbi:hypothetical protein D3C71_1560650 [compost metagenome]
MFAGIQRQQLVGVDAVFGAPPVNQILCTVLLPLQAGQPVKDAVLSAELPFEFIYAAAVAEDQQRAALSTQPGAGGAGPVTQLFAGEGLP